MSDNASGKTSDNGANALGPAIRRPLLADAMLSRLMDALTGGAFLAGLGLVAGANNFGLAVLAALPFLAQVAQLPAVALLMRVSDRRRVVVVAAGIARTLLLALAVTLALRPQWVSATRLTVLLGAAALLVVVATAAWNWWMRDLIPASQLGNLFGQRMKGATFVSVAAMLGAGALLDAFTNRGEEALGYAVLFGLGATAGLAGIVVLARTPHPPPPPSPPVRQSLLLLPQALRQAPRPLLFSLSASTLAASFALPFAAVYLLRGLGYSYLAVTAMAVVSQLAYLLGLRGWAHLSDRHGDRNLLAISTSVLALALAGWAAAGWNQGPGLAAWLTFLHFLAGFALGGIELANVSLPLRSTGHPTVAAHLAAVSLVRAVLAGLGVLAAGALWQAMGTAALVSVQLPVVGTWELRGFQVLCLLSVPLCLATAAAVRGLPAGAGQRTVDVARAMRREVHQMSSVAGMRGLIHAVSYYVELMAWPFAARQPRKRGREKAAPSEAPRPPAGQQP